MMKNVVIRSLFLCAVCAGLLCQVGCLPKVNPDERGGREQAQVPRAGGSDDFDLVGIDGVGGAGDWEDPANPLGGTDAMGADKEKRWEGVAVYFGYDKAVVGMSEQHKIEALAKHLLANPNYYVIIEGHCDERGSDEYNRALAERRALAVQSFLVSLGVAENRIRTVAYGEERPAVPGATTEDQHALNRRAEFILGVN